MVQARRENQKAGSEIKRSTVSAKILDASINVISKKIYKYNLYILEQDG